MRILLTGKNGQLGFELCHSLAALGAVCAIDAADCDFADAAAIRRVVQAYKPDVIVNPAAYTAVDQAESEPVLADAINARAPLVLAQEAQRLGAMLVHFSTDYVFDGSKSGAYTEADAPCPQSVYGATKLAGEQGVQAACKRHLVLRTSWVVGAHGSNFAKTVLRLAAEREFLHVVADQFGAPTSAALLADATAHVLQQAMHTRPDDKDSFPYGLYHVAAAGETSWCDYACFVVAQAIAAGRQVKATPGRIHAIATSDCPRPAKRPANSRLDTTRFQHTFGLLLPPWQDGVRQVLAQLWGREGKMADSPSGQENT